MQYASETIVSSEKSQAEIKSTLQKYGATKYAYYEDDGKAAIACEMHNRQLRFVVSLPNRMSDEFIYAGQGSKRRVRDVQTQHKFWEQACRQKWRAMALIIKAKFVAVESEVRTFEQEFLEDFVMPNGQTVGEYIRPQLEAAYASGTMPKLLPGIGETGPVN